MWILRRRAEVHLIRCLTTERQMRESCVVRVHVKGDQILKRAECNEPIDN